MPPTRVEDGHALDAPVLRALAERVAEIARPRPGETVVVAPGHGELLRLTLARATGRPAWPPSTDPGGSMPPRVAASPGEREPADIVASLLTLAHEADPVACLTALAARLRPGGGRLVAAVWGPRARVPHLAALEAALAVTGRRSAWLPAAFSLAGGGALARLGKEVSDACGGGPGARLHPTVVPLRDVVRFDGVDHLLATALDEAMVADLAGSADGALATTRERVARRLEAVTAADGTLVVPVELLVLVLHRA